VYLTTGVGLGFLISGCVTGRAIATGDRHPLALGVFITLLLLAGGFLAWQCYEQVSSSTASMFLFLWK
jgi:hypothetical protein